MLKVASLIFNIDLLGLDKTQGGLKEGKQLSRKVGSCIPMFFRQSENLCEDIEGVWIQSFPASTFCCCVFFSFFLIFFYFFSFARIC